jgi:hypothetical protein
MGLLMRRFFRLKRAVLSGLLVLERRRGFERMERGDGGGWLAWRLLVRRLLVRMLLARTLLLRECEAGAVMLVWVL